MEDLDKKLRNFSTQAKKLENYKDFYKNIKIEIKEESGGEVETNLSTSSEEILISVLVHFRNFYMDKSEFYFVKVAKEIIEQPEFGSYQDLTSRFLSVWNKLLDPNYRSFGGMTINVNKKALSVKRNLDLWMNEGYLHTDQYKPGSQKGLDAIKGKHILEQFSRFGLVDTVQRLCLIIINFNKRVIEKILIENARA